MTLVKDLIALFNVVARTEYNRKYKEYEPATRDALLFEYNSGMVESNSFPFFGFLKGMEEFTGSRKHEIFPEGYKFIVTNKEWDMSVDVPLKDLERAAEASSKMQGLDIYKLRIGEMASIVKDHPVELAHTFLEAGTTNTYGTTFDAQTLFSATHNYGIVAGSQNNIVTGTGTSLSQIRADILSVISKFNTFTYQQGGTANAKLRKLNSRAGKLLIVAPLALDGMLYELKNAVLINGGESNIVKDIFDYVTLPFTDQNDWYAVLADESTFKPFLLQTEKAPVLDMPTPSDENWREKRIATYGAYGRYNIAYGAWWKTIKVTNT